MSSKLNIKWLFVGTELPQNQENTKKIKNKERMPNKDRALYSSYQFPNQNMPTMIIDEFKLSKILENYYIGSQRIFFTEKSNFNKSDLVAALKSQFSSSQDGSIVVFDGPSDAENGDFLLCSKDPKFEILNERISASEVIKSWENRAPSQRHLLIIVDANYSEHWIKELIAAKVHSISILASSKIIEKSTHDTQIGSFLIHNLCKILSGAKDELIIEPQNSKQTPCFFGNTTEVENVFKIKVNFHSWVEMKQGLNNSNINPYRKIDYRNVEPKDLQSVLESLTHLKNLQFTENRFHVLNEPIRSNTPNDKTLNFTNTQSLFGTSKNAESLEDKFADVYEGSFDKNKKKQGAGIIFNWKHEKKYEGFFIDDEKSGKGVDFWPNQNKQYIGQFRNNKRNGQGKLFNDDGLPIYEGEFENDVIKGQGKEFHPNGLVSYEGAFANNLKHGAGKTYHLNGMLKYQALWTKNKINGEGNEYSENGIKIFTGLFKDNFKEGKGIQFYETGKVMYEGMFLNDVFDGDGSLFDEKGKLLYKGAFWKGEQVKIGVVKPEAKQIELPKTKDPQKLIEYYLEKKKGIDEGKQQTVQGVPKTTTKVETHAELITIQEKNLHEESSNVQKETNTKNNNDQKNKTSNQSPNSIEQKKDEHKSKSPNPTKKNENIKKSNTLRDSKSSLEDDLSEEKTNRNSNDKNAKIGKTPLTSKDKNKKPEKGENDEISISDLVNKLFNETKLQDLKVESKEIERKRISQLNEIEKEMAKKLEANGKKGSMVEEFSKNIKLQKNKAIEDNQITEKFRNKNKTTTRKVPSEGVEVSITGKNGNIVVTKKSTEEYVIHEKKHEEHRQFNKISNQFEENSHVKKAMFAKHELGKKNTSESTEKINKGLAEGKGLMANSLEELKDDSKEIIKGQNKIKDVYSLIGESMIVPGQVGLKN